MHTNTYKKNKPIITKIAFASILLISNFSANAHKYHDRNGEMAHHFPKVKLVTNHGDIILQLYADKAPNTVKNFLSYTKSGHYNGTIFHRVIDGFMIQGGGYDINMNEKATKKPIANEADNGLKNTVGKIAMARTNNPHSASSQFFINVANNNFLNHTAKTTTGWGYTVFGEVTKGMNVVNNIKSVKTSKYGMKKDVPIKPVIIKSVTILSK